MPVQQKTPSAGLKEFKLLWSLLRGVVVWSLWTDCIDRIFRAQSCSNHTIGCIHGIIAYERLEWEKVLLQIKRVALAQYLHSFERLWCPHFTLCARDNWEVPWNYQLHRLIMVINSLTLLVFVCGVGRAAPSSPLFFGVLFCVMDFLSI